MVAKTVPEGSKRGRSAQMAGQSPIYAIYGDAEGYEEKRKGGVGGNHNDYEKSERGMRERDAEEGCSTIKQGCTGSIHGQAKEVAVCGGLLRLTVI